MSTGQSLQTMSAQALRQYAASLVQALAQRDHLIAARDETVARQQADIERLAADNRLKQTRLDQLTHEMALLKRWRFGARSEAFSGEQKSLFEETLAADLAAIEDELQALAGSPRAMQPAKAQPKRTPLPAHLPRQEIRHEPDSTRCACGCTMRRIGEDVSEKLDYSPGVFTVQRHIRGKWACAACQSLVQAPVPAQIIDKGLPTAGLLAQVLVSKYAEHAPLYRQEQMFARAGLAIACSTLGEWVGVCAARLQPLADALRQTLLASRVLHADETPVSMLKPGHGKAHRAYLWCYGTTQYDALQAVVYDFAEGRGGHNAQRWLAGWSGTLVCDDYAGYKALFARASDTELGGNAPPHTAAAGGTVREAGCMAHARRKFHDLWVSHQSVAAGQAIELFGALYRIEREASGLPAHERARLRQAESVAAAERLHRWLILHRQKATDGTALAKAMDYSLKRWAALTRFLDDPAVPIDNNWIENRIRPVATGRKNWLFAGSLRAGQRAAAVMSLIQSARLNGHEPYAYLRDVLQRLPTQPNSRIQELLPHRWTPLAKG